MLYFISGCSSMKMHMRIMRFCTIYLLLCRRSVISFLILPLIRYIPLASGWPQARIQLGWLRKGRHPEKERVALSSFPYSTSHLRIFHLWAQEPVIFRGGGILPFAGREWELSFGMRPWIAVAYSAPVAAATAATRKGSFSDGMPLGISVTFHFMIVFQAEHNILMHPFH